MKTVSKWVGMFAPLVMVFAGLLVAIDDLKHPVTRYDQCRLVGRGLAIQAFKQEAKMLYQSSGRQEDDIAFQCQSEGKAVINDRLPVPLSPGQNVQLTIKAFRYFPQRYHLDIYSVQAKP